MSLNVVQIPPSEEELQKYHEEKRKEFNESFADPEKMTKKMVSIQVPRGSSCIGLCPSCGHCLTKGQNMCDECFQRLKWE